MEIFFVSDYNSRLPTFSVFDDNGILLNVCRQYFPHESAPTPKYRYFLQNVMLASTYATPCADSLWTLVVDKLLNLDVGLLLYSYQWVARNVKLGA